MPVAVDDRLEAVDVDHRDERNIPSRLRQQPARCLQVERPSVAQVRRRPSSARTRSMASARRAPEWQAVVRCSSAAPGRASSPRVRRARPRPSGSPRCWRRSAPTTTALDDVRRVEDDRHVGAAGREGDAADQRGHRFRGKPGTRVRSRRSSPARMRPIARGSATAPTTDHPGHTAGEGHPRHRHREGSATARPHHEATRHSDSDAEITAITSGARLACRGRGCNRSASRRRWVAATSARMPSRPTSRRVSKLCRPSDWRVQYAQMPNVQPRAGVPPLRLPGAVVGRRRGNLRLRLTFARSPHTCDDHTTAGVSRARGAATSLMRQRCRARRKLSGTTVSARCGVPAVRGLRIGRPTARAYRCAARHPARRCGRRSSCARSRWSADPRVRLATRRVAGRRSRRQGSIQRPSTGSSAAAGLRIRSTTSSIPVRAGVRPTPPAAEPRVGRLRDLTRRGICWAADTFGRVLRRHRTSLRPRKLRPVSKASDDAVLVTINVAAVLPATPSG